jgi:hypothetical protein
LKINKFRFTMALAWERLDKAPGFTFDLSTSHSKEPTEAFHACIEKHGVPPPPFSDKHHIWTVSREALLEFGRLIDNFIQKHPADTIVSAWEQLFELAIKHEEEEDDDDDDDEASQALSKKMASTLCRTGMQLARTPPGIFGGSFKENDNQAATLHLEPFDGCEETIQDQRHDMVMWTAAWGFFGNAWSYLSAESLVAQGDPSEAALKVSNGQGETFFVSRAAKEAMAHSIENMANRPTIFFLCLYVIQAVTKILGVNMLQYSMPQTEEELLNFNWTEVVWENMDTFPEALDTPAADFEKVRTVHQIIKTEKDAQARALGGGRSSVQSYSSYRARWKQWRDYFAVYRWIYPTCAREVVYDAVMADLKLCKSKEAIEATIKQAVKKHVEKLKRDMYKQKTKEKLEQKKAAAAAAEAAAEAEADEAVEKQTQLQEERQQIANDKTYEGTRGQQKAKRRAELQEKAEEEKAAAKKAQDAADRAKAKKQEQAELEKQKRKVDESDSDETQAPKKKRSKRNDVTHLKAQSTPREKMEANLSWSPPTRTKVGSSLVFEAPGVTWVNESATKLARLFSFRNHLHARHLLDLPMTFYNIMDFISADSLGLDFNEKVFLYLLALIMGQGRYVIDFSFP